MVRVPSRLRLVLAGYPELIAVLAAAILGLSVQPPLAWLVSHQGIDFAIAAALAAAVFGPAAAARLGLYGILVLIWGTAAVGLLRKRRISPRPGSPHQ
jgi:hypothetical protein